jgi:hypothetical protein
LTGRSFIVAADIRVRLTSQDCLPDQQVKGATGALHLAIFEQPEKFEFFRNLLERCRHYLKLESLVMWHRQK